MELDDDERRFLRDIVDGGKGSAEHRKRAHVLLLSDRGWETRSMTCRQSVPAGRSGAFSSRSRTKSTSGSMNFVRGRRS